MENDALVYKTAETQALMYILIRAIYSVLIVGKQKKI